ncbi:MAG: hypothetical protein ACRDNI_14210 [Gaiellaceae bacterium]
MSRIQPCLFFRTRSKARVALVLIAGAAALALAAPAGAHHRDRPHRPADINVTSVRSYSVTVRWTRVPTARTYRLYRGSSGAGWQRESPRTFTFWGLRCDQRYRLGVRALDREGVRSSRRSVRTRTRACPPRNTALPTISGTPAEGETLVASPGSWATSEDPTFAYQWRRCAADGDSCLTLWGVTSPTYVVGAADDGRTLRVNVTAENSAGARMATSRAVGPVGGSPPDPDPDPPPPPPPDPDPEPPPPDPDGDCTVADTSGCVPGTTLRLTDEQFFCNRPLSSWGPLPLKVVIEFTPGRRFGANGAIDLYTGCAGDANSSTIDLIVDVEGDGRTYGPGVDAFKVRQGAGYNGGIQLTGHVDCGPKYTPDVHQDGVQLQGGRNIAFVDFSVGDYSGGRSTCQGAGGAFFYSAASGYEPTNVDVVRGSYIACNHSLFRGTGTGDVASARFRSGRVDGSDPVCVGFHASPACEGASAVTMSNVTCQRWNRTSGRWE